MSRESDIRSFQQRCFAGYADSVDLPQPYVYPDGNAIRPVLPVCTARGSVMIVGAYPSARFEQRRSSVEPARFRVIPVADNLAPFAVEEYFDGVQVRRLTSGDGLKEFCFDPLQLVPSTCWITDLVKVFLYKDEHRDSCGAACPGFAVPVLRRKFSEIGTKGLRWLSEEVALAEPKLIITLGEEVARVLTGDRHSSNDDLLASEVVQLDTLSRVPAILSPHPEICRRDVKWRDRMANQMTLARSRI